jgi:hypothetical protein
MTDEYNRWDYHGASGSAPGWWMAALVDFAGALHLWETTRERDLLTNHYID